MFRKKPEPPVPQWKKDKWKLWKIIIENESFFVDFYMSVLILDINLMKKGYQPNESKWKRKNETFINGTIMERMLLIKIFLNIKAIIMRINHRPFYLYKKIQNNEKHRLLKKQKDQITVSKTSEQSSR
ncbi:hypothetical protein P344_04650 [Spiroplasma mirum ATCC 29335]|uniref:Uncharacterized protein n=1 Tax=Spiroplasma mirum ATCC 29335 TaxID=838561 RepID=W6AM70_9MOLU|nr:hypothetical protein [Spiroplasma mirum]AHI58252.1 hypothetical protein P344_04650 [Spiroplasma mirum ATCC 29335]AKM53274.1 hypothetical protein SATRI_v1c08390 [Spiroplasma atrichopogonis]